MGMRIGRHGRALVRRRQYLLQLSRQLRQIGQTHRNPAFKASVGQLRGLAAGACCTRCLGQRRLLDKAKINESHARAEVH